MPDDPLEALTADCGTCGGVFEVAWCPAWGVWLCMVCRHARIDAEFRVPLAARNAMQAAAERPAS